MGLATREAVGQAVMGANVLFEIVHAEEQRAGSLPGGQVIEGLPWAVP